MPLDADGVPVLTADLREQQESVVDTLHRVDNFLIENRESIKDTMLSAESYTASLKSKADAIDSILGKADSAFAGFDSGMDRITNALPGFADGKAEELFEKMKSLRELADTYKKKAATFMDDGRKMLSDLSESANNMTRKIDPSALPPAGAAAPAAAEAAVATSVSFCNRCAMLRSPPLAGSKAASATVSAKRKNAEVRGRLWVGVS